MRPSFRQEVWSLTYCSASQVFEWQPPHWAHGGKTTDTDGHLTETTVVQHTWVTHLTNEQRFHGISLDFNTGTWQLMDCKWHKRCTFWQETWGKRSNTCPSIALDNVGGHQTFHSQRNKISKAWVEFFSGFRAWRPCPTRQEVGERCFGSYRKVTVHAKLLNGPKVSLFASQARTMATPRGMRSKSIGTNLSWALESHI